MAIVLDGSDDMITLTAANDIFQYDTALTFYCKFYFNGLPASSNRFFNRSSSGSDGIFLAGISDGTIEFRGEAAGASTDLRRITSTTLSTDNEYVLILTWDGSATAANAHIYIGVNGASATEASYGTTQNGDPIGDNSGVTTYLCNRVGQDRGLDGTVREIAIFNEIISSTDIENLSTTPNRGIPLGISGCLRYYRLDDGADGTSADGDTIVDSSTSGVDGTGDDGPNNTGLTWEDESVLVDFISVSEFTLTAALQTPKAVVFEPQLYNRFKSNVLKGLVDLDASGAHELKVALLDNNYTFNPDHNVFTEISGDEVSGTNYTAGGEVLTNFSLSQDDSNDRATFDADDTTWSNSTITARYVVLYDNTLITKDLVFCIDLESDRVSESGDFTIQWHSLGLIVAQ